MKRNKSKLSLDTTTLRTLSSSDLAAAAGGLWASSGCATGRAGCSAKCDSEAHLTCSQSNWASKCSA